MTTETTKAIATTPQERIAQHNERIQQVGAQMASLTIGSKEWLDASLEVYKINKLIESENANIAKEAKEKEIADKRNERIKLVDDLLESHIENLNAQKSKTLTIDEKNAANDKFVAAKDTVTNELLARYATSTPSTKATGVAGEKGGKSKEILEKFIEYTKSLMDGGKGLDATEAKKKIVDEGYARGTVGAVVLKYQQENGLTA